MLSFNSIKTVWLFSQQNIKKTKTFQSIFLKFNSVYAKEQAHSKCDAAACLRKVIVEKQKQIEEDMKD